MNTDLGENYTSFQSLNSQAEWIMLMDNFIYLLLIVVLVNVLFAWLPSVFD